MELRENSQAARIARYGFRRWFTAIDVMRDLVITQVHARINDIRAAGGVVAHEPQDGSQFLRYMVTTLPKIVAANAAPECAPTSGCAEGESGR